MQSGRLKRTAMKPSSKPLARRTQLRAKPPAVGEWRGSGLKSGGVVSPARKPINKTSTKRKALNRELAAVVNTKRQTVKYCEAQPLLKAALTHEDNTEADRRRYVEALQACRFSQPTDGHHMLKRTRGSDATLIDPANILLTCSPCNTGFIESWPILATRAGLLIPSSARPRFLGRLTERAS